MTQVMTVRSQCFTVERPRPHTFCPIHHPLSYLKYTRWASRPGPYDMNWPLPAGAHLLAPFDHQVAGQSSMLRYDESTVCKPLITREHFVYQTLPECLREFTAEYRGELEVGLAEKDGYLQLYGLCVKDDSNEDLCQCSLQANAGWEDTTTLDVSKLGSGYPSSTINIASDVGDQSRCVIRVLRSGSYEMCSLPSDNNTLIQPNSKDSTETMQTPSLNPWSLKNHKRLLDKMRKGKHRHNSFRCILLKNVVADFKNPCILDLKIGSRLHGDEARPYKVENQTKKCAETTSSTLGVRLCGMQVFQKDTGQNINLDKYQGRKLTDKTFRETLVRFLHNGTRYRSELVQPIVNKLSSLIECLRSVKTYRFYASSLLIIYDGLEGDSCEMINQDIVGHSSHQDNGSSPTIPSREQKQTINGHVETHANFHKNNTTVENRLQPQSSVFPSQSNVRSHTHCDGQNQTADNGTNCSLSSPGDSRNDIDSTIQSPLHTYPHPPSQPPQTHSENNVMHSQTLKQSDSQSHNSVQSGNLNHSSTPNNHTISTSVSCSSTSSSLYSSQISEKNTSSVQVCKVDVKMIDFAHTTHQGFPNDLCRHEGPDMDYIQGLTNLKMLFENLMAEC